MRPILLKVNCINREVYSYISTTLFYETHQISAQELISLVQKLMKRW